MRFWKRLILTRTKSRIEPENFKQKRRWQKISCHRLFLIIEGGYGIPRAGVGIGPYRTTAIIARLGHTALCFRFTACAGSSVSGCTVSAAGAASSAITATLPKLVQKLSAASSALKNAAPFPQSPVGCWYRFS